MKIAAVLVGALVVWRLVEVIKRIRRHRDESV